MSKKELLGKEFKLFYVEQFIILESMKAPNWMADLKPSQRRQLKLYIKELCHFNQGMALFSRKQGELFCWNMILDSLLAGRILLEDNTSSSIIADIGSGAGFPGIIMAILDPSKIFWLYEINGKKAGFLEYMSWRLSLKNVEVRGRIQEETALLDCAVSKAFFSLEKRLTITRRIFNPGASYYHFLTLDWDKEWGKLSPVVQKNWKIGMVQRYKKNSFLSERILLRTDFKK